MNLAAASSAAKTTPRAYLGDMFTLPGDYELPDLSLVRSQAAKGEFCYLVTVHLF